MTRREYRHEMVEDPVTGHRYWQTRKVDLPSLDDERRMSLVSDILGGKPLKKSGRIIVWPV